MKSTITDVAKRAGVSMKTVSRVLNNEPNVAQKTRDRVKAVAAELHYSPNLAARGLASSKSAENPAIILLSSLSICQARMSAMKWSVS